MHGSLRFGMGLIGIAAVAAACSAAGGGSQFTSSSTEGNGAAPTNTGSGGTGTGKGGSGQGAGDITITTGTGGSGSTGAICNNAGNVDGDGDGWTGDEGDCNDCDPNVNPGAIEVIDDDPNAAPADEDCNGFIDDVAKPCDDNLAVGSPDAYDAAKAVELCQKTSAAPATPKERTWGVITSRWCLPDGTPAPNVAQYHIGHGMLPTFGPNVHVQAGTRMLGLSSGAARQPIDGDYEDVAGYDKSLFSGQPTGFPKESPSCSVGVATGQAQDGAAVEIQIRVPTNATGFTFDFNFFTYEWPVYVCTQYNDFFVAQLSPIPAGQTDGNISFDSLGNPVSVNNAFVDVCSCAGQSTFGCSQPVPAGGCCVKGKPFACALGTSGLDQTGFTGHGSTGWLVTKAPAKGGEIITMRWTVYDAGDGYLDSTTLIDNWKWVANGGTVTVGTDPIGTPK